MAVKELLAKCNPNRHGNVRLFKYTDRWLEGGEEQEGEVVFVVCLPGDDSREGDGAEFDTEEKARVHYDAEVKRLSNEPNWEAQAAYDEQWGTDNGYAPLQAYGYGY